MTQPSKLLVLSTAAVGLVVLVGAAIALKDRIREEWWTRKLEIDDGDGGAVAAVTLGNMHSVRAIPALLRAIHHSPWKLTWKQSPDHVPPKPVAIGRALVAIGKPGAPVLIGEVTQQRGPARNVALTALKRLYEEQVWQLGIAQGKEPEEGEDLLILKTLADSPEVEVEVRQAAAEALKRMQGTQDEAQR